MKNSLSTLDLAIWVALLAGQVFLCLCILKKRFYRRLAGFSVYALISTAQTALLFVLAFWASYEAYYYSFYITGHLISVLALVTLIECGRQVIPGLKVQERDRAIAWLLVALALVITLVCAWPLRSIGKRVELGAYLTIAVTFIFIAAYSRYLGLYWSRLLAGITSTLGLLYLIQGATKAMIGHYPMALVVHVRQISQIANVLAVVAWIVFILSPWGEYQLSPEQLRVLERNVDDIEANLRDLAQEAERVA